MAAAVLKRTSPDRAFSRTLRRTSHETARSDMARAMGAAREGNPRHSRMRRVASGGWMAARSRIGPWQRGHSKTSNAQEQFSYCISCSRTDIWYFFGATVGQWVREPVKPLAVIITD